MGDVGRADEKEDVAGYRCVAKGATKPGQASTPQPCNLELTSAASWERSSWTGRSLRPVDGWQGVGQLQE